MRLAARFMLRRLPVVALLLIVIMTGGCREPEPLTFRYHLSSEPNTLDPVYFAGPSANGIIDRIFDGLMVLDRVHNLPVPCLAISYTISDDHLVYTFQLDPEARFHNGRRLLAMDVKYSWERLLAPATNSELNYLLGSIRGADRFQVGEAEQVSGIEVVDSNVVRVHLTRATPSFLYILTNSATSIVPHEELARLGLRFAEQPVGCGPFRFVAQQENQVVLEAFTDHHRYSPQVRRLVFVIEPDLEAALRRYQNDELDLVSQLALGSLGSLRQGYAADLHFFPGASWYGFCFDCAAPPFDDPRVRRAIALSLDRDQLVKDLDELQYAPVVSVIPSTVPGHIPISAGDYCDPALAAELLAEAGYPQGRGLGPLVFTTVPGRVYEVMTNHLQLSLAALGLDLEPRIETFSNIQTELRAKQVSFYRFGWYGAFLDPEPYLRPLFYSQGRYNHMSYSNPELDRVLDLAAAEQDTKTRRSLYRQAEEIVIAEAPCVPLFQRTEAILLRPFWKDIPIGFHRAFFEIEKARLESER